MLEALYDYAMQHDLAAIPGFKPKKVKHYLSFAADGRFLGFETVEEGTPPPMCPDIGSLANGTTKSNIIAEKAEVILDLPDKNGVHKRGAKQQFYLDALAEAATHDARFIPAAEGLRAHIDEIRTQFEGLPKAKAGDLLSIKVDGVPLESSTGYLEWWETFRKRFDTKKKGGAARCFITGAMTEPVSTVPPVQGLVSVGGHTKGDSFICFDKDAYRSYGFEQAANATVSEEAVTAVNAALAKLMQEAPPPLAGAKSIHWFSEKTESDVLGMLSFGFGIPTVEDPDEQVAEDEQKVRRMYRALMEKSLPEMPKNRYYMMSLSGVNGRVMIRSYEEGTFDSLCSALRQWYTDLAIVDPQYGVRYPKLYGVYSRLLKFSTDKSKLSDRIANELSGIAPRIMYAILHGTPLPDAAAAKALAYIRSDMYAGQDDTDKRRSIKMPDRVSCQFLKAWLNRKYRDQHKEEWIVKDQFDPARPSVAYQTGRLMAVYANLQNAALGDVNAGVVERYYTSACTAPALVMGKLGTMAQNHLSKLRGEKPGLYQIYSRYLEEISGLIGTTLPKRFSLEQQSEFALGYYFQCAHINDQKAANKKTSNTEG